MRLPCAAQRCPASPDGAEVRGCVDEDVAWPLTGQRFSQMPQPMHRSWMTTGRRTVTSSPV